MKQSHLSPKETKATALMQCAVCLDSASAAFAARMEYLADKAMAGIKKNPKQGPTATRQAEMYRKLAGRSFDATVYSSLDEMPVAARKLVSYLSGIEDRECGDDDVSANAYDAASKIRPLAEKVVTLARISVSHPDDAAARARKLSSQISACF